MYGMFQSADRNHRVRIFVAYMSVYAVFLTAMGLA
jgi:hypothetical protein